MPRPSSVFETGAATHAGKLRERNEDSFLIRPAAGIWAVADGMGGHDAGDLASRILVDALAAIAQPRSAPELLAQCEVQVAYANEQMKELSRQRGAIIGTTMALLLAFDNYYACVWSGDSRIYIIRSGLIKQLSCDHTEVQELVAQHIITPQEAQSWPSNNVITRAIGVFDNPELEVTSGVLESDDSFVICSDGLTRHLSDDEIRRCVAAMGSQQACNALIDLTLERGAVDNVTVVVVRYRPDGVAPPASDHGPPDVWE